MIFFLLFLIWFVFVIWKGEVCQVLLGVVKGFCGYSSFIALFFLIFSYTLEIVKYQVIGRFEFYI